MIWGRIACGVGRWHHGFSEETTTPCLANQGRRHTADGFRRWLDYGRQGTCDSGRGSCMNRSQIGWYMCVCVCVCVAGSGGEGSEWNGMDALPAPWFQAIISKIAGVYWELPGIGEHIPHYPHRFSQPLYEAFIALPLFCRQGNWGSISLTCPTSPDC